jgi:hypothetical protein
MATIEDAVTNLESIMRADLPALLTAIEVEKKDGIRLEPPRTYEWEEIRESLTQVPAVLLIGQDESDVQLRDIVRDATITVVIITTDRNKTHLTKKLYRYAKALRQLLRPNMNRTLNDTVISAKVVRVSYSPTFVDRDNLYARDLQAEVVLRIPKEND